MGYPLWRDGPIYFCPSIYVWREFYSEIAAMKDVIETILLPVYTSSVPTLEAE